MSLENGGKPKMRIVHMKDDFGGVENNLPIEINNRNIRDIKWGNERFFV